MCEARHIGQNVRGTGTYPWDTRDRDTSEGWLQSKCGGVLLHVCVFSVFPKFYTKKIEDAICWEDRSFEKWQNLRVEIQSVDITA